MDMNSISTTSSKDLKSFFTTSSKDMVDGNGTNPTESLSDDEIISPETYLTVHQSSIDNISLIDIDMHEVGNLYNSIRDNFNLLKKKMEECQKIVDKANDTYEILLQKEYIFESSTPTLKAPVITEKEVIALAKMKHNKMCYIKIKRHLQSLRKKFNTDLAYDSSFFPQTKFISLVGNIKQFEKQEKQNVLFNSPAIKKNTSPPFLNFEKK